MNSSSLGEVKVSVSVNQRPPGSMIRVYRSLNGATFEKFLVSVNDSHSQILEVAQRKFGIPSSASYSLCIAFYWRDLEANLRSTFDRVAYGERCWRELEPEEDLVVLAAYLDAEGRDPMLFLERTSTLDLALRRGGLLDGISWEKVKINKNLCLRRARILLKSSQASG